MIDKNEQGNPIYKLDSGGIIELYRYSDPERLNMAHSASIYLGKEDTDNIRRPIRILEQNHTGVILRGESATFVFHNVSKQVYDHLITYQTLQMRVAGGNRALVSESYTIPIDKMRKPLNVEKSIKSSMDNYHRLIVEGETPQVARSAMPINANMNPFKLQFNFQTLAQHLFPQRIWTKGAQGLTAQVVQAMYLLLLEVDREFWEACRELYGEHAQEWVMVQRRLRKRKVTFRDLKKMAKDRLKCEDIDDLDVDQLMRNLFAPRKSMWD